MLVQGHLNCVTRAHSDSTGQKPIEEIKTHQKSGKKPIEDIKTHRKSGQKPIDDIKTHKKSGQKPIEDTHKKSQSECFSMIYERIYKFPWRECGQSLE